MRESGGLKKTWEQASGGQTHFIAARLGTYITVLWAFDQDVDEIEGNSTCILQCYVLWQLHHLSPKTKLYGRCVTLSPENRADMPQEREA